MVLTGILKNILVVLDNPESRPTCTRSLATWCCNFRCPLEGSVLMPLLGEAVLSLIQPATAADLFLAPALREEAPSCTEQAPIMPYLDTFLYMLTAGVLFTRILTSDSAL